jgi:outer membrane biosynthesis protein TonB
MEESKAEGRRRMFFLALVVLVVVALIAFGLNSLLGGHGSGSKKPPKISLLPATPPPPPPPPKEEKREPPKEQKEVKLEPVEKKDEPPADPSLKMEGAAGDGPSLFAAGKVTNEDLSRMGAGGTGGGLLNPFNTYGAAIKSELQRYLGRRAELKRRQYRIELRVWVADDGRLKNFELLGTTNDVDTDEAIRSVLVALPAFSEPPPPKMPQPIRLRIIAGGRA